MQLCYIYFYLVKSGHLSKHRLIMYTSKTPLGGAKGATAREWRLGYFSGKNSIAVLNKARTNKPTPEGAGCIAKSGHKAFFYSGKNNIMMLSQSKSE